MCFNVREGIHDFSLFHLLSMNNYQCLYSQLIGSIRIKLRGGKHNGAIISLKLDQPWYGRLCLCDKRKYDNQVNKVKYEMKQTDYNRFPSMIPIQSKKKKLIKYQLVPMVLPPP